MNITHKRNRGFTLIELLVVISIIGLLSSVVLASVTTARNKGRTAAIKESMYQMRNQMALYYSVYGNYGNVTDCTNGASGFTDGGSAAIRNKMTLDGATNMGCIADTSSGATMWSLYVTLPAGGGLWCVDANGSAKAGTDVVAPLGQCD